MKAIIQHRYGGPETLEYGDIDAPVASSDQVLIKVHAASVNAADWLLMHGQPYMVRLMFGLSRPKNKTKGRDFAGVIAAVGSDVTGFQVGDEVYGETEAGSFAEYTLAAPKRLARKPANLSFIEAATLPIAAATALQALRTVGKVQPGHRVLVNGASGGVGTFAIQIAKLLGAHVTGVCSARNADLVRSLGADQVIDYSTSDFTADTQTYDVVIDLAGKTPLRRCRRVLNKGGMLVLASGTGGRILGPLGRILRGVIYGLLVPQRVRPLVSATTADDLVALRAFVENGSLRPCVERVYPVERAGAALRHLGVDHAGGKIAISV